MRGFAALTLRGVPFLSKAHGVRDLQLHADLAFSDSAAPATTASLADGSDATVRVSGSLPAIVFEDMVEGEAEAASTNSLALAKPPGTAALHLLGGRLLLRDAADARWHCGSSAPAAAPTAGWPSLNASAPIATLDFQPLDGEGAAIRLTETPATGGEGSALSIALSADGARFTVGGGALLVDGSDVRHWHRQYCE